MTRSSMRYVGYNITDTVCHHSETTMATFRNIEEEGTTSSGSQVGQSSQIHAVQPSIGQTHRSLYIIVELTFVNKPDVMIK